MLIGGGFVEKSCVFSDFYRFHHLERFEDIVYKKHDKTSGRLLFFGSKEF